MKHLVSVYITTYKRPELLRRALESVIKQDYRPIEIIVVDDASGDDTRALVETYQAQYQNADSLSIIFHEQETNQGACAARNVAIYSAKGDFITGLDDDDEFEDNRLSLFINNWSENFPALSTTIRREHGKGKVSYLDKDIGPITLSKLLSRNTVGSQIFTKTKFLQDIGGFDPAFPAWQDYDCWIRFIDTHGPINKLNTPTYIMHLEHEKPRISTSNKGLTALRLFIAKHAHLMSPHNIRRLKFKELEMSNQGYDKFTPWIPALTLRTFPRILKRVIRQKLKTIFAR